MLAAVLTTDMDPAVTDLDPTWFDGPEAAQAMRIVDWPHCTTDQYLGALALVIDSIEVGLDFLAVTA